MVMWTRHYHCCLNYLVYYNLIDYAFLTSDSPAVITISDPTPDSSAAFPFLILLIDSLIKSLSVEQGMLVIVSA